MVETWPAQSFSLPVPGASLHVVTVGPEGTSPIIALHSGPGDSHDILRPWLDRLATDDRRVVYYDQRGSGQSPLVSGTSYGTWREHVDDLHRVLLALKASKPVLLGHSWGGLLAMLHALEHPESVGALILVAPSPVHAADGALLRQGEKDAASRPDVVAARARFNREGLRFAAQVAPYLAHPERAGELSPPLRSEAAAKAARASLAGLDLRERLAGLAGVPALVVHGDKDPLPADLSAETARLLGGRLTVIPESGHVPFFEQPAAFLGVVESFLRPLNR